MVEKEVNTFDFFLNGVDWLSVINDGISYDEMLSSLEAYDIEYSEKYFMNKKYAKIEKGSLCRFLMTFHLLKGIRITRLDFKLDFNNSFTDVFNKYSCDFNSHSEVSKKLKFETIYFNSRQSDLFCRLYDKTAESNLDFPLTRLEYEIKGNLAFEFSARFFHFGFRDAINWFFEKINEFNSRKGLSNLFYISTTDTVDFKLVDNATTKEKFRRFVKHNKNSYKKYSEYFNLSAVEMDGLLSGQTDLEDFLNKN